MRGRRLLMMMAGISPTPLERRMEKETRSIIRYARELQAKENLMEMILRRERGEEGARPMPFAGIGRGETLRDG